MPSPSSCLLRTAAAVALLALAACGGGGGGTSPANPGEGTGVGGGAGGGGTGGDSGGGDTGGGDSGDTGNTGGGDTPVDLVLGDLQLAQTHVVPPQGKTITGSDDVDLNLHMVGNRAALALVEITPANLDTPVVEGRVGTTDLGTTALQGNDALPATESDGVRYSATARPATLPAAWLQPGLQIRVDAANANNPTDWIDVRVGADPRMAMNILPFYLYGADDDTVPLAETRVPPQQADDEMFAKWPLTALDSANHGIGVFDWPSLVISPRNGGPAYVTNSKDDELAGFDILSAVLSITRQVRNANGEAGTNNQYYAPIVHLNAAGDFRGVGGGLGGGHTGTGDHLYRGIFIHEQGHAFGMPHSGEDFDANGGYPYIGGSHAGSAWGFDQVRQLFQPFLVPSSANRFANCRSNNFGGTPRQVDNNGDCIRQDPMQSGSGDQAAGDLYTTFSDYNAAVIQRYFEGNASDNENGDRVFSGGRIFVDPAASTGYSRWDSVDNAYVEFDPTDDSEGGLRGINRGYPIQTDTPVVTVVATISKAGTDGATQIYPLSDVWDGNLQRLFDPTDADDRAEIQPNTSTYFWYCRNRGCDYTFRVTHAGGVIRHYVIQRGFRVFFTSNAANFSDLRDGAEDPNNGASFMNLAMNIPADLPIVQVELLDTPRAFNGIGLAPPVLASRLAD